MLDEEKSVNIEINVSKKCLSKKCTTTLVNNLGFGHDGHLNWATGLAKTSEPGHWATWLVNWVLISLDH